MNNLHGDLARAIVHEPSDEWPDYIEIRAYWKPDGDRRARKKATIITAEQFFGRGHHGAPMTGDQLINIIERLRKR